MGLLLTQIWGNKNAQGCYDTDFTRDSRLRVVSLSHFEMHEISLIDWHLFEDLIHLICVWCPFSTRNSNMWESNFPLYYVKRWHQHTVTQHDVSQAKDYHINWGKSFPRNGRSCLSPTLMITRHVCLTIKWVYWEILIKAGIPQGNVFGPATYRQLLATHSWYLCQCNYYTIFTQRTKDSFNISTAKPEEHTKLAKTIDYQCQWDKINLHHNIHSQKRKHHPSAQGHAPWPKDGVAKAFITKRH